MQFVLSLLDNPLSQMAAVVGIVAFLRQFIELIPDARPSSPRANAYLQVATGLVAIALLFVITAAAGHWSWDAGTIFLLGIQALIQCGVANAGYTYVNNQKKKSDAKASATTTTDGATATRDETPTSAAAPASPSPEAVSMVRPGGQVHGG